MLNTCKNPIHSLVFFIFSFSLYTTGYSLVWGKLLIIIKFLWIMVKLVSFCQPWINGTTWSWVPSDLIVDTVGLMNIEKIRSFSAQKVKWAKNVLNQIGQDWKVSRVTLGMSVVLIVFYFETGSPCWPLTCYIALNFWLFLSLPFKCCCKWFYCVFTRLDIWNHDSIGS